MFFLIASIVLALYVVAQLVFGWREIAAFESIVVRLRKDDQATITPFKPSPLGTLANDYIAAFSQARTRGVLQFFHVDQALSPIATYLRSISLVPRALVGILILLALIVTLFNLQGAVGALGIAFRDLSTSSTRPSAVAPTKAVDTIQLAMSSMASAASNAFQTSATIILIASVLLGAATALQWQSQRALRGFSRWAHTSYFESLPDQTRNDLGEQIQGLAGTVARLEPLIKSLSELGKGLSAFTSLENRMDDFSRNLNEALGRLPGAFEAGLEARMDRLSGSVAQGIHSEIQHQIEYILRIVKIYGDQELRVKEIHGFMAQTLEQSRAQSTSLQALSQIGPAMEKFADSVVKWSKQAAALEKGVTLLDTRVSQMPVMDINASAQELRRASQLLTAMQLDFGALNTSVKGIREEVANFTSSWKAEFNPALAKFAETVRTEIAPRLSDLEAVIRAQDAAAIREHIRHLDQSVSSLSNALQHVATTVGDVRMDQEFDQLKGILQELSQFSKEPGIKHFFWGRD